MMLLLLAVFFATLSPVQLWADWQYTRWGMKPEEVVRASGNVAMKEPDPKAHSTKTEDAVLFTPYTSGRFKFRTTFLFDKNTGLLGRVHLELLDPHLCHDLHGALFSKYGKPESENKMKGIVESSTWRDVKNNNGMGLLNIGGTSCSIQYWPLTDKEKGGL